MRLAIHNSKYILLAFDLRFTHALHLIHLLRQFLIEYQLIQPLPLHPHEVIINHLKRHIGAQDHPEASALLQLPLLLLQYLHLQSNPGTESLLLLRNEILDVAAIVLLVRYLLNSMRDLGD